MRIFTDSTGREWSISLNLGTAMAVRDKLGVDLLQPEAGDPPLLTRLGTDELLLGEVLCTLLMGQFEAHGVTGADVRTGFDGQTLLAAQKAFYDELVDFFQSRGRMDRAKAVAKQVALIEMAIKMVDARLDAFDIDETIRGAMSGESQAPSESIPDP